MIRPIRIPLTAVVLASLAACGGASRTESAPPDTAASQAAPAAARDTLVRPAAVREDFTLLDSATADVDGDGTPERVDLAAMVGLDDKGVPLWDDGQMWLVAVRDGADTYPLIQEHVQWGGAAFWIVHEDTAGPATILVQTSILGGGSGGMRMDRFAFDRRRGGYVRTGSVSAFGQAAVYRGPPGIGTLPPTLR